MLTSFRRGGYSSSLRDRGTVLLMFPAAMLIMLVLGGLVIDVSLSQVRGRELDAVASSAANDALAALDIDDLRTTGEVSFNLDRAELIVAESVAAGGLPAAEVLDVRVEAGADGPLLIVELGLTVDLVIAPALPGNFDVTRIERSGTVTILG